MSGRKMNTLIIKHEPDSNPPKFSVIRGEDSKAADPVEVVSPYDTRVQDLPDSNLMAGLAWYLETFLDYPYDPWTVRAENIRDALDDWGKKTFTALFGAGKPYGWFDRATEKGDDNLRLQIMSDDPVVLGWPWEALHAPEKTYLSVASLVERRMNGVGDPVEVSDKLPKDRINILLVTARPYDDDVHYRSISRPLVELIEKHKLPAKVHVLRPPTFERLLEHLKERPDFYHVVHFDGHGGYGVGEFSGPNGDHQYQGPEGVLVFEDDDGKPNYVKPDKLSALLRKHAVPMMVLNACQSAMISDKAEDPFASVAAALVKAGIRGVVAMAYSLYVSAAQEFLPAFYRELFGKGDLSHATLAGRQKMLEQDKRVCARGTFPLRDFVVPVIYQLEPYKLPLEQVAAKAEAAGTQLPEEAQDASNPYGFIGRDRELLKLERALRKDTPAVLISGLGGVGKTTLAKGFVKWLGQTEGMQGCLWQTFIDVRSAEFVINQMGSALFGSGFLQAKTDEKLEALVGALRANQFVIVWDNFEVVAGIDGTYIKPTMPSEDRQILKTLLERIRGGKSKVIITSRSNEDWLGIERQKISIGGLRGEERWEYCDKILGDLGIEIDRTDKGLVQLMKLLDGHPLAMRVVLPRLESKSAQEMIKAIKTNMADLGEGTEKLYSALQVATDSLSDELQPLLIPLALHERYVDADLLEHMVKQVDEGLTRDHIDTFCGALASAGVLRDVGQAIYELHPALTGYLRSSLLAKQSEDVAEKWTRAFVDVMGSLANELAPKELHEQRDFFLLHGANFHYALAEATRLQQDTHLGALTQSLAQYSLQTRNFDEAFRLFELLAANRVVAEDKEGEAGAYHQLGRIAEERRDFNSAETWYRKSLAISEKQYKHRAAQTYHQLGVIAQQRRDFNLAETWYQKSLAIKEKHGDERGAAKSYGQLGSLALMRRDYPEAESLHLRTLELFEKLSDYQSMAMAYHQLGLIAREQGDFNSAETWYRKSLAISEKQDRHGAALTYHELGVIAQQRRDFNLAETWYQKSLAIKKKQDDENGAASTLGQLGILAGLRGNILESGTWLIKSIRTFRKTNDQHNSSRGAAVFKTTFSHSSTEDQAKLRAMWEEADIGPFPEIDDSADEVAEGVTTAHGTQVESRRDTNE